jgi:hypothetical protein
MIRARLPGQDENVVFQGVVLAPGERDILGKYMTNVGVTAISENEQAKLEKAVRRC